MGVVRGDRREIAFLALIVVAVGATLYLSWSDTAFQTIATNVLGWREAARAAPLASAVVFFLVCMVATSICFPIAPLLGLSAGFIFGFRDGLALLLPASTIGSTVAMLASRNALRPWTERKFGTQVAAFRQGFERHDSAYLLMVRFNPFIPYWLVNLLVGLTDMKLRTYVPLTFVGLAPASILYATTGSHLETIANAEGPSLLVILALLVLSLAPLAPIALKRFAR